MRRHDQLIWAASSVAFRAGNYRPIALPFPILHISGNILGKLDEQDTVGETKKELKYTIKQNQA